jgi:16S rRNA (guanine966-N2)-methyltransferase
VRVVTDRVERFVAGPGADGAWDLVLLDPPYAVGDDVLAGVLAALPPLLAPAATVVVERSTRSGEPTWPPGLEPVRRKAYGETTLWTAAPSGPSA